MKLHVHSQTTPQASWTINHNLGSKPVFDVWVDQSGAREKIFPASVVHVDDNTLIISFSIARSGTVRAVGGLLPVGTE